MRIESARRFLVVITALAMIAIAAPAVCGAEGEEGWRREFDDVCGKTSESQSLSTDELGKLVDRCDKLKPQIEKLGESERKVFLRRLKMCRDLYDFMLETRREGK